MLVTTVSIILSSYALSQETSGKNCNHDSISVPFFIPKWFPKVCCIKPRDHIDQKNRIMIFTKSWDLKSQLFVFSTTFFPLNDCLIFKLILPHALLVTLSQLENWSNYRWIFPISSHFYLSTYPYPFMCSFFLLDWAEEDSLFLLRAGPPLSLGRETLPPLR